MGMSVLIGMFSFSAFGLCRYEVVNAEIVLVCDGDPPITPPPNWEEVWVCKGLNVDCHYELRCNPRSSLKNKSAFQTTLACSESEVESCSWQTVCSNPSDPSSCTQQMVCTCISKPGDPGVGPRCEVHTCGSCVDHMRFCGYWDRCTNSWSSGQKEGC